MKISHSASSGSTLGTWSFFFSASFQRFINITARHTGMFPHAKMLWLGIKSSNKIKWQYGLWHSLCPLYSLKGVNATFLSSSNAAAVPLTSTKLSINLPHTHCCHPHLAPNTGTVESGLVGFAVCSFAPVTCLFAHGAASTHEAWTAWQSATL